MTETTDNASTPAGPQSMGEFATRFAANEEITGYGIGNVYIHMPCPFCAAKDFIVYEMLTVEEALSKGARCKECKRSARGLFTRTAGGVSFEIVQEHGPDQPDWLVPKMRRLGTEASAGRSAEGDTRLD